MTDPNLKIAMDKRDEALREAEGWEEWIRAYTKLLEVTVEAHDRQKGQAKVAYSSPAKSILPPTAAEPTLRGRTIAKAARAS